MSKAKGIGIGAVIALIIVLVVLYLFRGALLSVIIGGVGGPIVGAFLARKFLNDRKVASAGHGVIPGLLAGLILLIVLPLGTGIFAGIVSGVLGAVAGGLIGLFLGNITKKKGEAIATPTEGGTE
jgi:hypothetical protein